MSNFLGLALELCDVDSKYQCSEPEVLRPPTAVDLTILHGHSSWVHIGFRQPILPRI